MKNFTQSLLIALTVFSAGCVSSTSDDGGAEGSQDWAVLEGRGIANGGNGCSPAAIQSSLLLKDGKVRDALTSKPLRNGSVDKRVISAVETDGLSQEVFSYIVQCALDPEDAIDVTDQERLPGHYRLAPQWGQAKGHCDTQCKEIVSACVLALSNLGNQTVDIQLASPSMYTGNAIVDASYKRLEGAYWGNIFQSWQRRYGCYVDHGAFLLRTCANLDDCEGFLKSPSEGHPAACDAGPKPACDTKKHMNEKGRGYYGACDGHKLNEGWTTPVSRDYYKNVVTVWKQ